MNLGTQITGLTLLWAVSAQGSQLLTSISVDDLTSVAPFQAPEGLQFVIEFASLIDPGELEYLGRGVFWQDEANGYVDFSGNNSAEFTQFQFLIANGTDDWLNLLTHNAFGSGGGPGNTESGWGLGNPDLTGNQIDFIRLVVHDLSIQPYNPGPPFGDGLQWEAHITWQFWGTTVPEPATLVLLGIPGFLWRHRRRS